MSKNVFLLIDAHGGRIWAEIDAALEALSQLEGTIMRAQSMLCAGIGLQGATTSVSIIGATGGLDTKTIVIVLSGIALFLVFMIFLLRLLDLRKKTRTAFKYLVVQKPYVTARRIGLENETNRSGLSRNVFPRT